MTTVCCTVVKTTLLCLALFVGLSCLGCVNEAPNCTNFSGVHNLLPPENVTVQTGDNATFTSKSTCHSMKVYVNGCEASGDSVRLSSDGDVTTLTYTAINASLDESGNSVDFIMFCDGLSCYRRVFVIVLDPPIEPADITVNTTCSGFNISFISSDATVLTVTSSNGTIIYNGTIEPSVNFVAINNRVMNNEVYALQFKSYNEVGQSKHVIKNITTDVSVISFEISDVSIKYVNDVPQANVTLNVNNDCILSVPRTVDVKCACLSNTSESIFLNGMYQFILNLVNYKEMCDLTIEGGTLQVHKSINTTAVTSVTVNSHLTHDGYFHVNATLQKGVAGIMIQVEYINGTLFFKQPILRKPSSDYAGANNTRPLPNGTFYLAIYMLKSDGVSFDLSRPIMKNIVITSLLKSPDEPKEPKQHGFPRYFFSPRRKMQKIEERKQDPVDPVDPVVLIGPPAPDPPVREGDPPVREGDPPVREGDRPVRERDPPVREGDPPVREGDPPVREGDPPVRERDPPVREGDPPVRERDPPVREGDPPVRERDPPVREGDPPVREGDPPVREGDPPVRERDPPVHEGDPPVREGDPPVHERDPPVREGDPPVRERDPPVREGDPPVREGDPPVREGDPPVREGDPSLHQGDPPVHQGDPPLRQGDPPIQVPQQVQEDPLNKERRQELSIPSNPTNSHLVLTEPVPPLPSPVSVNPPTPSHFENFGFNNNPSVSIQNNSVTYSSTGDGSDCPLMKHDHAPVVSSYQFTPSQSTEDEKFKKPEEVKAGGGPFKFVYSWRSNK